MHIVKRFVCNKWNPSNLDSNELVRCPRFRVSILHAVLHFYTLCFGQEASISTFAFWLLFVIYIPGSCSDQVSHVSRGDGSVNVFHSEEMVETDAQPLRCQPRKHF